MHSFSSIIDALQGGAYDKALENLYGPDTGQARQRAVSCAQGLLRAFSPPDTTPAALFSGPGRTELGGNHTDHQHGHVLCASVDMDMLACAAVNGLPVIRVHSEGYPPLEISLDDLAPKPLEGNTSAALVRGVADRVRQLGHPVGGFDAYITSNVLPGSGVSSSAAYEVLLGNIVNHFFCGGALQAAEIAKIGQYAESVHFGKPCGLLDQMGSSIGGAIAIDFADPSQPVVKPVGYDFSRSGYALCIVDTRSSHGDLTEEYAAIPREMGSIAAHFGKAALRDVPEECFRACLPVLRAECGDRAVLRALHYYAEDRRAIQETQALGRGDFAGFLSLVNDSGASSALYLQNTWPVCTPQQQAIPLALAIGRELLAGKGAIRVHGGGFAGTVQAFVPQERLPDFRRGMEELLGEGACHVLRIRPQGGCAVIG